MKQKKDTLVKPFVLFLFIFVVWASYRYFFKLPESLEEFLIKPLIWLVPTLFLVLFVEKRKLTSVGITTKNFFPSIYFSLALGAIFLIEGLILNFAKYGQFSFGANIGETTIGLSILISFATGISEETAFRGYIFSRIWEKLEKEWVANFITSLGWVAIHLPVNLFVLQLTGSALFLKLILTFIFGLGSSFVYARTKNVFSSIFLHVLWEWPIILFR